MRAEVDVGPVRERRRARPRRALLRAVPWRRLAVWVGGSLLAFALVVGVLFAGSSREIAAGVRVAGVNVAGLTPEEAAAALGKQSARYAGRDVVFIADGERFPLSPKDLDAHVNWDAVAAEAQSRGNWPMPFRGIRRVGVRLFGVEVTPAAELYEPRFDYELERMAKALDTPGRNAAIVLEGLETKIEPHREGKTLDRSGAKQLIARALAGFDRASVALPVAIGPPAVTSDDLEPVLAQARTALSAPVRFGWKDAHWTVQPKELAELLQLPANGRTKLAVGGRAAERYFGVLSRAVNRIPQEASFAITTEGRVRVVPSASGRKLDEEASGKALLTGALSADRREAELVVRLAEPRLNTQRARGMKVTDVLASYTSPYSGTADRITNLQLAARLIDGTTLAPGQEFSINRVVGPRTTKRGFKPAPTIIEGEYKDAPGGGVSQIATTVFNAAWEAGIKITSRTAHSLYISRYPLGRDATVNYPDVDLRFENDTDNWMVVRAQSGGDGITISLLGAPTGRRVVSEPGELRVTGPPETETVPDPTLYAGEEVVEDAGEPSRAIAVKRIVYVNGKVLYSETWYTSYQSEPKIVREGTIPLPDPPPPPPPPTAPPPSPPPASTGPTQTGPGQTTPTTTTAP
ncbi:MAG: VanW family protein [Actinobacteria bacterium]|nr:VanW family protein [Actinomycetota bacterium]